MISRLALAAGVVVLITAGCAPAPAPPVDTSADVAAINALVEREMAAFTAPDMTALQAIFAEDAHLMPPGESAVHGVPGLITWTQAMHEAFAVAGEYTSSDVTVSSDLAVQRFTGRLTLTPKAGGDAISETVKGLHVLRRQADGSWKITQDVWNTDQAPAAPAAPTPSGGNR